MWCDKKDKLEIDCLVTFNSNSNLRACITWRVLWKCSGEREGSLSSAKSSLWPCGGLGRGKRNRAGNIVHHKFCLIIAIFILEYPSAGSAEERRETTCKGQINLPFKFEPHARPKSGDLLASFHRLQPRAWSFSISRVSPTTQSDKTTVLTPTRSNDLISQWVSLVYQKFTAIFFSAVKSCQDFYHFDPEK